MLDNVAGSRVRLPGLLRMTSPGIMYILFLMLALYIRYCRALGNDILGLAIPTEPSLDANTVCKTYPGLSHRQYNICRRFPDVAASAIQGVQIAIHECQYQFRSHRWNCSALETKNKNPHLSPFLTRGGSALPFAGFRETAFAYAITAAGMTTQVARACSLGKLTSCGCSKKMDDKTGEWKWRGCNHNMEFANHYVKRFLRMRERAKDIHSQTNKHNNRAGRLVVRRNQRLLCKCHGMSGSCEVKTCWKAAPPFRTIGAILKKKYERATKVDNANSAKGKLRLVVSNHKHRTKEMRDKASGKSRGKGRRRQRRSRRRPRHTNLVYFERSPNFCDQNPATASSGTVGRYCNRTSSGIDNCETLCCGRGYNTLKVTRSERCECRFHWCCYVVCKTCVFTQWVTVCK